MTAALGGHVSGSGDGAPLVFVHGFPLDGRMWERQVPAFGLGRRVLVPDLAGFGGSPLPGAVHSIEDHAKDVAAFMDRHGALQAALCGFSMGGYVALAFASLFPDRLLGLVLANTRAGADTAKAKEGRSGTAERLLRDGTGFLVEEMARKLVAPAAAGDRPDVVGRLKAIMAGQDARGCAAALLAMRDRADRTAELAAIRCPALVVAGTEDVLVPAAEAREMAGRIPGARLVEIHGAGHAACMEKPEDFNRPLAAFLAELRGHAGEGRA